MCVKKKKKRKYIDGKKKKKKKKRGESRGDHCQKRCAPRAWLSHKGQMWSEGQRGRN